MMNFWTKFSLKEEEEEEERRAGCLLKPKMRAIAQIVENMIEKSVTSSNSGLTCFYDAV